MVSVIFCSVLYSSHSSQSNGRISSCWPVVLHKLQPFEECGHLAAIVYRSIPCPLGYLDSSPAPEPPQDGPVLNIG